MCILGYTLTLDRKHEGSRTKTMRLFKQIVLMLLLFIPCASIPVNAQNDTITANPNAVKLRRLWMIQGKVRGDEVGTRVGGIGDVNRDLLADFAVFTPGVGVSIFYGDTAGPSTTPVRVFPTLLLSLGGTVTGDFWGTGSKAVGLNGGYLLFIYRTEQGRLAVSAAAIWD